MGQPDRGTSMTEGHGAGQSRCVRIGPVWPEKASERERPQAKPRGAGREWSWGEWVCPTGREGVCDPRPVSSSFTLILHG